MATPQQNLARSNQSVVFESFADHEKLTITEVTNRVNEKLRNEEALPISEQTVRRAIKALMTSGFLKEFGRQNNATLYGKISASWADSDGNEKLISLAGNLVTVEDFLRLIADESETPYPFVLKVQPQNWAISDEFQRKLRKRLIRVILTSIDPGYNNSLQNQVAFLNNHIEELEYLVTIMKNFLDSPVWYAQYRDRISYELRKVQEKNPDLFKLAVDYMKEG